jgi:hypothetical protein
MSLDAPTGSPYSPINLNVFKYSSRVIPLISSISLKTTLPGSYPKDFTKIVLYSGGCSYFSYA